MCGASLLPPAAMKAAEPVSVSASGPATAEGVAESPSQPPRSAGDSRPSISGPSFLGLNDSAPSNAAPRKRASLSIDPHSAPGSNLDYLLDEEEPPEHHWGIGKMLLIFIALALAAGFGYLRFKNQGLAWLSQSEKPAVVAQNSTSPNSPTTPAPSPSITPDSQPPAAQPTATNPQPAPSDSANAPSTPAPAASAPATAAPSDSAKPTEAPSTTSSDKAAAPTDNDSASPKETVPDTSTVAAKPVEKPKPTPKPPAPKPSAGSRPGAYDPVVEAQKYLYGRGAPQDCDRGMRLLKPAANQGNPKAMIEMGALYSAGLCTPHDLPTAYRWFALALRKDPENTAVQADLQKLWGEMTKPERQLAIKLTQ